MCHGLPRGRQAAREGGAKGLLGDGPGNVVAFSAIPKRSCQATASESTAVTRSHLCSNSAATGLRVWHGSGCAPSLVFGRVQIGSLRMLIPSMEQEGFEVGGVGGKSLGG